MEDMNQTVEAVAKVLADRLTGSSGEEQKLGFISDEDVVSVGVPKVYVKDIGGGSYWYFYDTDKKQQVPIKENTLMGTIVDVQSYTKESDEWGNSEKLDVFVQADRKYIVESGLDSVFSRGLLASLENADTSVLDKPVRLQVGPGTKPNVVVSELFTADGDLLLCSAYKHKSSDQLLREVQTKFGFKNSEGSGEDTNSSDSFEAGPQRAKRPSRGLPT